VKATVCPTADGTGVVVPLAAIARFRVVFPAEWVVHGSRGLDRTQPMPTRFYSTRAVEAGLWATDDVESLRLLHNDFDYVLSRIAKVPSHSEFLATSTNYGSNPFYCIRRPSQEQRSVTLFYLEQEDLAELHSGLCVRPAVNGLELKPVRVRFCKDSKPEQSHRRAIGLDQLCCKPRQDADSSAPAFEADGQPLPNDALIFTAPAIIWDGEFVGWQRYTRETYDCRHVVNLQYLSHREGDREDERIRSEIQRLQRLWGQRDLYVNEVNRLVGPPESRGYAEYERMIVGVGGAAHKRYLLLWCIKNTAEGTASQLRAKFPDIEAALQIAEGGGTGILTGTQGNYRVVGPSSYRRGRVLCCLLVEMLPGWA